MRVSVATVLITLVMPTWHASAAPWRSRSLNKQLVAQHKHALGGGKLARESVYRYVIEGKRLSGERKHKRGHVSLIRSYKPLKGRKATEVTEQVLVSPIPFTADDAKKAELTFKHSLEAVEFAHINPPDRVSLYRAALRGMLGSVGPYTRYVPPAQSARDERLETNSVVGVGVELGLRLYKRTGAVSVRFERVLRSGPAYRAGVRKGDYLLAIDGKPLKDVIKDTDKLIGDPDTQVKITVRRDGKRRTFTATRQPVDLNKVTTRLSEDGIATIKLKTFDDVAKERIVHALARLEKRHQKQSGEANLRGLIFDLRDDPGGNVGEAAMPILRLFIGGRKRKLVTMKGPTSGNAHFDSEPSEAAYADLPMTVLVNRKSASASELVAGVLQDLKRATVIGERTFGKGVTQTILPVPDGGRLILTTDSYHLPSGRTPNNEGIIPDVSMEQARASFTRKRGDRRRIVDYSHEHALKLLRQTER